MDKYRRVQKKGTDEKPGEDEMRITGSGSTNKYVGYAAKVFQELNKRQIVIKATGMALPTAIATAEIIKRRIKGLTQVTKLGSNEVEDEYEPMEDGLEPVTQKRHVTFVEIYLSLDDLDKSEPGWQAPLPESEVVEVEDMKKGPAREVSEKKVGKDDESSKDDKEGGKGGGKKKGKGKKGKGKGGKDSKGKGKKGKGKGKKGKGKGKGKKDD